MKNLEAFVFVFVYYSVTFIYFSYAEETLLRKQEKCYLSDSPCLTSQAQNTLQAFIEGIPELGIEKMDELHTESVIAQANGFNFNWTNIKVEGLKNTIINNVSINMELKTLRVSFETTIHVTADSAANGVLLSILPIFGDGKGIISIKRLQMEIFCIFDIVKDDSGMDFMDLKKFYTASHIAEGVHHYFGNLYNGDEKKSEFYLNFINDNWTIVMANYGDYFNKKFVDKIFKAIKIYMRSRPLDDLALY